MYTQIHSDYSYYFIFDNIDFFDYFDQVICVCTHTCIDMCELMQIICVFVYIYTFACVPNGTGHLSVYTHMY